MDQDHGNDAFPLDGNAAAGILRGLFALEMTEAILTCGGCGAVAEIGAERLYGGTMGAILRCVNCSSVVIRLVHTPNGFWLDMRGVRRVFVPAPK
jgi:Family of unknown function (DUF6510)